MSDGIPMMTDREPEPVPARLARERQRATVRHSPWQVCRLRWRRWDGHTEWHCATGCVGRLAVAARVRSLQRAGAMDFYIAPMDQPLSGCWQSNYKGWLPCQPPTTKE